jgi:hypothetical protein
MPVGGESDNYLWFALDKARGLVICIAEKN